MTSVAEVPAINHRLSSGRVPNNRMYAWNFSESYSILNSVHQRSTQTIPPRLQRLRTLVSSVITFVYLTSSPTLYTLNIPLLPSHLLRIR